MKTHTTNFKNAIKTFGRQLDSQITYKVGNVTTTINNEHLYNVTPTYEGKILKSVMKELDFESDYKVDEGTEISYKFGVKVGSSFEYLQFGKYIVYSATKNEDTGTYTMVCYDKILYSMKDYEDVEYTFPMTIREYISAICNTLGITFQNGSSTFANYNKVITKDYFLDSQGRKLGYTFRDVLDQLAEVTASTICINNDDKLEIRYPNQTNDTIDENFLKDINVRFSENYGPINTIVLARSGDSDKIYYPSTLPASPFEYKITDNQIMSENNRDTYMPDIYNKLNGFTYAICDYSSTGICYYDLCDKYSVSIDGNVYNCLMLNDTINITQGLEENIYAEEIEKTETDYKKSDTTDRRINQAYIMVDKQNQEITTLTSRVEAVEENVEILKVDVERNVVVVPVPATQTPTEVSTYNVGYSVSFWGLPVTVRPTTTDTHTGITCTITDSNITFSTTSGTRIPNLDNKYTFTWTYEGYTLTKVIMVSLVVAPESADQIEIGTTAPTDTSKLWLDTSRSEEKITDQLKRYNSTAQEWEVTNDFSTDIDKVAGDLELLQDSVTSITQGPNSITSRVATIEGNYTELEPIVRETASKVEQTDDTIATWFTNSVEVNKMKSDIKNNLENITEYQSYIFQKDDGDLLGSYIQIGAVNSPSVLKIYRDRISFINGENETAYLSDKQLYITNNTVLSKLEIGEETTGKWIAEYDKTTHNLNIKWGGGN